MQSEEVQSNSRRVRQAEAVSQPSILAAVRSQCSHRTHRHLMLHEAGIYIGENQVLDVQLRFRED